MRRVLIISPHFPPVNAPDMHRARLALPHLRDLGWEPVVAAVAPPFVEGAVLDPVLERTYPADVRIVRSGGLAPAATRWAGIGSLWFRCGADLRRQAERLLAGNRFDLVFFSTTQFGAFPLGPRWRKKYGVPYVLDLQDPWVNDYYARTGTRPPGGTLKYGLSQWHARRNEPQTLREAGGVVAVSDDYGPMLARRYPWFDAARVRVVPFGASELDLEVARTHRPSRPLVPFGDGCVHLVYAGRVVDGMAKPLGMLFDALRRFRASDPAAAARLRLHFIGTNYAAPPRDRPMVLPLAQEAGVAGNVHEHTARVPYFDALHYLTQADGLLAIGSDDPGYSASKIFPCLLAKKPLLAIYHRESPVQAIVRELEGVVSVDFDDTTDAAANAESIRQRWFASDALQRPVRLGEETAGSFNARSMTRDLVDVFNRALSRP